MLSILTACVPICKWTITTEFACKYQTSGLWTIQEWAFEKRGGTYFELKTAQSVLNTLGAIWTLQEDKNALKANLELGNAIEEVEWEAESLEMPDGGVVEAYPIGAGSLIWEEVC